MSEYMYKLKVGVYKILQALEEQEDTTAQSTVLDCPLPFHIQLSIYLINSPT